MEKENKVKVEKENKVKEPTPTYCCQCNKRTGYGFGIEPMRYDIHWCTSECHAKFYNLNK